MNIKFDEFWQNKKYTPADFLLLITKMKLLDQLIPKSVADAAHEWLVDLRIEERSPQTIRFYKAHLTPFVKAFPEDYNIAQITPSQVKQYMIEAQGNGDHLFQHHARFRSLRAFFNWAKKQKYISDSPLTINAPKIPEVISPTFSDKEIIAMLKTCPSTTLGLRDKAIILTLLDTGMRLGELLRMTLNDIELEGRIITVLGKGRKYRRLKISRQTLKALWDYLKARNNPNDRVWLSEEGNPLTENGVQQIIERVCKRAGITGRRLSPHTFRHTFACNFLDGGEDGKGGDSLDLQYLLGHSTLKMVEHYSKSTKAKRAMKAQERLSTVDRLNLK